MPQVQINFKNITKTGLKSIIAKFEKKGMPIDGVEANNIARRQSGFLVKDASLFFESGQKLVIRVKADGVIFQVKLNNKVLPIKNVDNMSKAVDEVIQHVKENEKRYLKAKEKRLLKKKLNLNKKPKVITTRRQKIDKAEGRVAELQAESEDLQQKIETNQKTVETKKGFLDNLSDKLLSLQERGKELLTELNSVKAELETT